MIPGDIVTAVRSMMLHLGTVTDGPDQFAPAPAGIPLDRVSADKSFELVVTGGGTRQLTGISGKTWRHMQLEVRVLYYNEGRDEAEFAALLVQDAQRLQEALVYNIRQLPTAGYTPGSIAAIPGVENCEALEDWTAERPDPDAPGKHILTIPLSVKYVDDVSTT